MAYGDITTLDMRNIGGIAVAGHNVAIANTRSNIVTCYVQEAIKSFSVNAAGIISAQIDIDSIPYSDFDISNMFAVAEGVVAQFYSSIPAYGAPASGTYVSTFTVDVAGNLALNTTDLVDSYYANLYSCAIENDLYVLITQDTGAGILKIITMEIGAGGATIKDGEPFVVAVGYKPRFWHVDGEIYAFGYRDGLTNYVINTISIDSSGNIGSIIDSWTIPTTAGFTEDWTACKAINDIQLIAYEAAANQICTFRISSSGYITKSFIDTYTSGGSLWYSAIEVVAGLVILAIHGPTGTPNSTYLYGVWVEPSGNIRGVKTNYLGWRGYPDCIITLPDVNAEYIAIGSRDRSGGYHELLTRQIDLTPDAAPVGTTDPATNISYTSATINGTVIDDNGGGGCSVYFQWSYDPTNLNNSTTPETKSSGESFSTDLSGLVEGRGYYFRAVFTNAIGTTYGDILYFIALKSSGGPPYTPGYITTNAKVQTLPATNVSTRPTLNGEVVDSLGYYADVYFEYGTGGEYGARTSPQSYKTTGDTFSTTVVLAEGRAYHYRAVMVVEGVIVYGNDMALNTPSELGPVTFAPGDLFPGDY